MQLLIASNFDFYRDRSGYEEDLIMVHLVYCDNAGKKGERVLDKI